MWITNAVHQIRRRVRTLAETHQSLCESPIRVHRHMPCDVMEDVRLGKVIQMIAVPNRDRGGKFAISQAIEKKKRRHIPADGLSLEAGQWTQKPVDVFESRNRVRVERQRRNASPESCIRESIPARQHPRVEPPPGIVIAFRILFVWLVNEKFTRA